MKRTPKKKKPTPLPVVTEPSVFQRLIQTPKFLAAMVIKHGGKKGSA